MQVPGADPAAAIKTIQKEMQEAFDEAGMGSVKDFTDMVDNLMKTVKAGPKAVVDGAKDQFDQFKIQLENAAQDPASLAGGGPTAMCASYYAQSVTSKLKGVGDDVTGMVSGLSTMASDSAVPLKTIADTMEGAMEKIESAIAGLAKLPQLVASEFDGKDDPADIAKVDTSKLKKALDGGDVGEPLDAIKGIGSLIQDAVDIIEKGVVMLTEFLDTAPDKVKDAFSMPQPLCFFSVTPKPMTDLLDTLNELASINFSSITDALRKAAESVGSIDADALKKPLAAFKEKAGGLVDKLDNTVQGAKLASGGGAGAMMGAIGK